VEIGELANATRCFKYWSLKGPEPKEKILDEIADVIHFWLRMLNFDDYIIPREFMTIDSAEYIKARTLIQMFNRLYCEAVEEDWFNVYGILVCIIEKMGYTKYEVEAAYEKKYEENFERQCNGY
jgi:dimeric dUTPase (all-alpha-NTP-PPase superfamily)